MNKQVKIKIKDKDYYCDMEVLKLIERLQDKVELLEYNRDKAIEYIEQLLKEEFEITDEDNIDYGRKCQRAYFSDSEIAKVIDILRGEDNE